MKSTRYLLSFLFIAIVSPSVIASISVDSLNFPVWVERGERSMPVAPGDRLLAGDVVQTGKRGRIWLSAEDGSVIKLGQETRFAIERAGFREDDSETLFDAAFNVLKGAFRFTSGFFTALRPAKHRVDFQVGAVTAGVRGTDIWGRSGDDEDFVALLEGRIEVSSAGESPVLMDTPLTLYRKASGQAADPVAPVEPAVVASLAPETELNAAAGIVNRSGRYNLVLQSLQNESNVAPGLERFRGAGYPAVAREVEIEGIRYTRIQLESLADREAAINLRQTLSESLDVEDAWISENK
jgi:hypothetical protein